MALPLAQVTARLNDPTLPGKCVKGTCEQKGRRRGRREGQRCPTASSGSEREGRGSYAADVFLTLRSLCLQGAVWSPQGRKPQGCPAAPCSQDSPSNRPAPAFILRLQRVRLTDHTPEHPVTDQKMLTEMPLNMRTLFLLALSQFKIEQNNFSYGFYAQPWSAETSLV